MLEYFNQIGKSLKPKVSIRANGTINIAEATLNKFKAKDSFLKIAFDPDTKEIVFTLTDTEIDGETVKASKAFSLKSLFDYYDVFPQVGTYLAYKYESVDDSFAIDTNEPLNAKEEESEEEVVTMAPKANSKKEKQGEIVY